MSFETPNKSLYEKPEPLTPEKKERMSEEAKNLQEERENQASDNTDLKKIPVWQKKIIAKDNEKTLKHDHPEYFNGDEK